MGPEAPLLTQAATKRATHEREATRTRVAYARPVPRPLVGDQGPRRRDAGTKSFGLRLPCVAHSVDGALAKAARCASKARL